jgi:hypothetical protein
VLGARYVPRARTTLWLGYPHPLRPKTGAIAIVWVIAALLSSVGFAIMRITDKVVLSGMGPRAAIGFP